MVHEIAAKWHKILNTKAILSILRILPLRLSNDLILTKNGFIPEKTTTTLEMLRKHITDGCKIGCRDFLLKFVQ